MKRHAISVAQAASKRGRRDGAPGAGVVPSNPQGNYSARQNSSHAPDTLPSHGPGPGSGPGKGLAQGAALFQGKAQDILINTSPNVTATALPSATTAMRTGGGSRALGTDSGLGMTACGGHAPRPLATGVVEGIGDQVQGGGTLLASVARGSTSTMVH
ncbi:unnamed protein product, partial [Discosporangium mesarthrocarpum]